jgi:hypothetical protein
LEQIVHTKRMNNCEAAVDLYRRQLAAAKCLCPPAVQPISDSWTFLGLERPDDQADSSQTQDDGTDAANIEDVTTRASTDGTIIGASVTWHAPPVRSPDTTACRLGWKGDRNRPSRATSAFSQARVASAVDALIGSASTRRASSAGRAAGAATSRISRTG